MAQIEVDEEVYRIINTCAELTGWTHSQVITRLAAVRREQALAKAESLKELADLAPSPMVLSEMEAERE
ncbi:hypothetical protein AB0F25_30390 [Streptomyces wedmorensis]|uniref:hypothetical protein n=1 Tax=Streptomyces wedmorensis TaxID=43759 RepID=UPI003445D4D9